MCFFRAPPRIVRNPLREMSVSPSVTSRGPDSGPRVLQSPALLSDAVKRLSSAAQDRQSASSERSRHGDDSSGGGAGSGSGGGPSVLRIMDNLFMFSHVLPQNVPEMRKVSEGSRQAADDRNNYAVLPTRRSSVFIKSTEGVLGVPDPDAAARYVLKRPKDGHSRRGDEKEMEEVWKVNAGVARLLGRGDHERVFRMLAVLEKRRREREREGVRGETDSLLVMMATRL